MYPVILPKGSAIVSLLIQSTHRGLGHIGTNKVHHQLQQWFWIVQGRAAVKSVLGRCLLCRRLYRQPESQMMAPLPSVCVREGAIF